MNLRHAAALALLLLCSCANNAEVIAKAEQQAKATQEAEVAASRAEASANAAEKAADRAEQASKGDEQGISDADDSVRRGEDVFNRLCTPCLVCLQGSGPAVERYWKYRAIQEAACSAAASPPVKRSK
jgi:hypothetical protein